MTKLTAKARRINGMIEKLVFIQGTILYDPLTDSELDTVEKSLDELYAVIDVIDTKYFNPSDGTSACHPREDD